MVELEVEVINRRGLHARAAAKLVQLSSRFRSQVTLERSGDQIDAKSILGLLQLGAAQGAKMTLRCDGADEHDALNSIAGLFSERFGEER